MLESMTGSRMRRRSFVRLIKLLLGSLAALAVLAVLLVTALLFLDPGIFRGQIEAVGARAFDRRVTIEGPIRLKPSLHPLLVVEDVWVGNPEWASRPDFAHIRQLEIRVALLPLLRGELVTHDVSFRGADLLFEVGSDGSNNFTFGRRRGPPGLPDIDWFTVWDSLIAFRDASGEVHSCAVTKAEARNAPGQPVNLVGQLSCRDVPLQFDLSAGTAEAFASRASPWPLKLTVSTGDASLAAEGFVPRPRIWKGAEFQVSVQAEKVDSLERLLNVVLPLRGPFDLSAELRKSEEGYSVSGLRANIGSTDIMGEVEWRQAGDRFFLKGKLASQSMQLRDLFATPDQRPVDQPKRGLLDRPLPLDWLAAIEAELELDVQRVVDSPVPIRNAAATITLSGGSLALSPWRATLAGTPVAGDLTLVPAGDGAECRLAAETERLDLGDTLAQPERGSQIRGSVEDLTLTMTSRGHTLRALLQGTDFNLKTQSGRITSGDAKAGRPWTFDIAAAEIAAKKAQPIKISVEGDYRDKRFALVADTVTLEGLATGARPWPLSVSLRASEARLSARGSVTDPFKGSGFDLTFELAGKDVSKLDPLLDYVIPLRGEYHVAGRFSDDANRYSLSDIQVHVGQSDIGGSVVFVMSEPRLRVSASLRSQTVHYDDLEFVEGVDEHEDRARVIPEYTLPVESLRAVNLDIDFKAGRIRIGRADFGDLKVEATVENGVTVLSVRVTSERSGAILTYRHQGNVATDPPVNNVELTARDLDYGLILTDMDAVEFAEGRVDLDILLAGPGATQRSFLGQASGHITITGGPGRIASRAYGLWSDDLVITMLSGGWSRETTAEINCIVGRIVIEDGVAKTDKLMLDAKRITIAGSGVVDLNTEKLDVLLVPRPKQARLVSAANPVRVTGTLANPKVAVTVLPKGQVATTGLLAGLVNPALLVFAFSDTGSGGANPCVAALEKRDAAAND